MTDTNTVINTTPMPGSEPTASKQDMPMTKKNYWPLIIVLLVLLVGITTATGVAIGYYLGSSNKEAVSLNEITPQPSSIPSVTTTLTTSPSPTVTANVEIEETLFGVIRDMNSGSLTMAKMRLIGRTDPDYEKYCGNDEYCENGYYIIDLNKTVTLDVSPNVKITVINIPTKDCALNDDVSPISMSLSSFLKNQCDYFGTNGQRVEVKATNGVVTEIKQIFFP